MLYSFTLTATVGVKGLTSQTRQNPTSVFTEALQLMSVLWLVCLWSTGKFFLSLSFAVLYPFVLFCFQCDKLVGSYVQLPTLQGPTDVT